MPDDPAPLKSHWFHILVALADRDLHGSGIARDALDRTEGEVRMWPATLYGAVEEMTHEGLIRELGGEDHPDGASERRRYYRITPAGREVLREEAARLVSLADAAFDRLRGA